MSTAHRHGIGPHIIRLVFVLVITSATAAPHTNSHSSAALTVVTYNINWGCAAPDRVIRYLLETDADLIALQETHSQWETLLVGRLHTDYPYRHFHHSRGAGGIAILSKYVLTNVQALPAVAGWFPALLTTVNSPLGPVQLLNVHLQPPLSRTGSLSASAYFNSGDVHVNEMASFMTATTNDLPLIIAGDFNEGDQGKCISELTDGGFVDALPLYDRASKTWRWKTMLGLTLKNRLDHILFDSRLHCTDAKVTTVNASDHMPVSARFVTAASTD